MNTSSPLHTTDFFGWTQQQAHLIRSGQVTQLDLNNLLEEIESMGRSEQRALESRLEVLLMHLLKWQYQPALQSRSWASTIKIQRFEIKAHLDDNPSLKHTLDETVAKAWQGALIRAEHETGLDMSAFPTQCPWAFEQTMDADFWPEAATSPAQGGSFSA